MLQTISTSILAGDPLVVTLGKIAAEAAAREVASDAARTVESAWDRAWEQGKITWIDDMPVFTG
jgi:hypothetical protein